MRSLSRSRSSSHVSADGAVAGGDRGGVADHHAGVLPAAGELDGVGGGAPRAPSIRRLPRSYGRSTTDAGQQFRLFADDAGDVARWRRVEGLADAL